ncbi:MAG: hypothetical protein LBR57_01330 [Alistipes sp.]|jgi:signal transduction histidine kinase|nr:hypothetical protein [Alistipes sp.]
MNSEEFIWPVNLTFISTTDNVSESLKEWDITANGIFDADHLQGFLGSLANIKEVQNPLTLYQFVSKEKSFNDPHRLTKSISQDESDPYFNTILGNRKMIRLDTDKQFSMEDCCTVFRKDCVICEQICRKKDSRVALLLDVGNMSDNDTLLKKRVTDYNDLIENERNKICIEHYIDPNPKRRIRRYYLRYRCEISNLDEFIFPIVIYGKTIGCLMMGRIPHPDFQKEIDMSFPDARNRDQIETLLKEISPLNNDKIDEKIRAIHENIQKLETRIEKQVELTKQRIINQKFAKIKTDFQNRSVRIDLGKKMQLAKLGEVANDALKEICRYFHNENKFIRIFAALNPTYPNRFTLFAHSDSGEVGYFFDGINIESLRHKIENDKRLIELEKEDRETVRKSGSPSTKKEIAPGDALRILPTTSPKVSFIIWKKYFENTEEKDATTRNLYKDSLIDLYVQIAQAYASLVGYKNEKDLENSIRIAGHEAGQILPRIEQYLDSLIKKSYSELVNSIRLGKFHRDIEDIHSQISFAHNIYEKSRLVFKDDVLGNKVRGDVRLSDMLVKLAKVFRPAAAFHGKSIPEPGVLGKTITVNVEQRYFEHILYNLLDNAVKYGYSGSNILIDVQQTEGAVDLSIISYGMEIKDGDKIYDLYHRSDHSFNVEGLGIGMFIAKKVTEAHGFMLSHSSQKLSPQHIPILFYNDYPNKAENHLFDEVVALDRSGRPRFTPGRKQRDLLTDQATYRNKFTIRIPNSYIKPLTDSFHEKRTDTGR